MKRKHYFLIAISLVVVVTIIYFSSGKELQQEQLTVKAEKGEFEILVTVTGELQAISSVDIMGPSELRNSRSIRIRDIKIQDLVAEGTVVDSGEYVGSLDRSEVGTTLKDFEDELETVESQYLKTKLDTTMQLRELRDQLVNLKFSLEEKQIVLDQSKYEPPATIRQATIDLEKAQRAYEQAKDNYQLKVQQAKASMNEATIELERARRKVQELNDVLKKFTIFAPQAGMVIYKKEWNGQKRKVGSMISPWDLTVATLPDLSEMSSKTYVNEIDISKVKEGQKVRIGVDAFPENKYTGIVSEVANIGEQLPNTDAKVFEVLIHVDQTDSIMRPAMTTSNQIITDVYQDVIYIPLEALHNEDSLTFVYTTSHKKQVVVTGASNENYIIVEQGLDEGEEVYLSVPENIEKFRLAGEELIPVLQERERIKREMQDSSRNPSPKEQRPMRGKRRTQ
ncbi:MAG: efflux RND transporter periplasmic adaptor subunit [Bacteroidales bacterium]|jgi:multidrug efflux pump subunit AcrA (membrane-fusion protein)|nr:efflux RND transporter periplasmic adaptor subunit [Bacteroidales bacterium]